MEDRRIILPKVGDRLMRTMTSISLGASETKPSPCVVTYVNAKKKYYTVEFVDSGVRECYKPPIVNEIDMFKDEFYQKFGKKAKGVYVYESGAIYPSISECARAIGVRPCTVSSHIHGRISNVKGYHIYIL